MTISSFFVRVGTKKTGVFSQTLTTLPVARVQSELLSIAPSPNRREFYYTRLNWKGRDCVWNELLKYDAEADRCLRTTANGRYRFPAISPDGRKLAAIRDEKGYEVLLQVSLDHVGEIQGESILIRGPELHSLLDPVYSPDGKSLVYILAGEKGSRVCRINLAAGADETLLDWPCSIGINSALFQNHCRF